MAVPAAVPAAKSDAGTLPVIADSLLSAESSGSLLASLEESLASSGAIPARLYLYDGDAHSFYAAAGLGCPRDAPDLLARDTLTGLGGMRHALHSRGNLVGLLEILAPGQHDHTAVGLIATLLGPMLMAVHRHEGVLREVREVREEVTQLLGAGELLRHFDLDVLLVKILETVMGAVRAEVGAVLTRDDKDQLTPRVVMGFDEARLRSLCLRDGRMLADTVAADGKVLCLSGDEVRAQIDVEKLGANLTGLLALPLTTRDRCQGVVVLANPEGDFGPAHRRLAETVCSLAAIALDNALLVKSTLDRERLQRELDLAKQIQHQMYPEKGLRSARVTVEGYSRPCDETGGDYYAFIRREGRVKAMIGDVSGHGLGAALYTTMAHAIVQQQLRSGIPIEPAFESLNEALFHTQSGRFMTAALVDLDPETLAFSYVSAGHNPLLWLNNGEPRWLESCGMPLGIVPVSTFPPPPSATLAPGDLLVLYTDGFTEAANPAGEQYGEERLVAVTRRGWDAKLSPEQIALLITADVDAWAGGRPHEDDLTMVVIGVDRA